MALFLFWERWGLQWSATKRYVTSLMRWASEVVIPSEWTCYRPGDVQNHAEKTCGPDGSVFIVLSGILGSLYGSLYKRMCHSVNVHCIFDGDKSSVCRTWILKVAKYYTEQFEGFALDAWIPWWWGKKGHMPDVGDQKAFDTYSPSQSCCITQ